MQRVKLNRTILYQGKMLMRNTEVTLDDETMQAIGSGSYEPLSKVERVDVEAPRNTAIESAPADTNIAKSEAPKVKKPRRKRKV